MKFASGESSESPVWILRKNSFHAHNPTVFTVFLICTCFLLASIDRYLKKKSSYMFLYQNHVHSAPCCNFSFQYRTFTNLEEMFYSVDLLLDSTWPAPRTTLSETYVKARKITHGVSRRNCTRNMCVEHNSLAFFCRFFF